MQNPFSNKLTDRGKETPQGSDSPRANLSGKRSGELLIGMAAESARIKKEQSAQHNQDSDTESSRKKRKIEEKKGDIVDLIFNISQKNKDISRKNLENRNTQINDIYSRMHSLGQEEPEALITKIRGISSRIGSHEDILISHERDSMIIRYALTRKNGISDAYKDQSIDPSKQTKQKISSLKNEYDEVLENLQKFIIK